MNISLSVPAAKFSDLASVTPVSSRLPATATRTVVESALGGGASVVNLSDTGIVLAATFGFEGDLLALQAGASATTAESVTRRAEGLVAAFNTLQENLAFQPPGITATEETSAARSLSQTLNALVTTTITGNDSASLGLGSIGITLQTAQRDGITGVALGIDREALAVAIADDAPRASALLNGTIQSLIDRTAAFESQATTVLAAESSVPASILGTPTDAAANDDAGLALSRNLTDRLLNTASSTVFAANTSPGRAAEAASYPPTATAPVSSLASSEVTAEVLPIPTLVVNPAAPAGTQAAGTAGANAIDREAFAARLALQTVLDNPTRRSLDIIFDPAYAALMAATHPSDFIAPTPTVTAPGMPDTVQPIVPIRALDRIAGYADTGGEPRRRVNTTA